MPAAASGADGASRKERIDQALNLLNEALKIIDEVDGCDLAAAQLQEAIDCLHEAPND